MKFSERVDATRAVEEWFKTKNKKINGVSIAENIGGTIAVLKILGYFNNSPILKCSACGKKYNEDQWPNAWRCNNCF
ncbi:MAG: hypothetical protein GY714_20180 [Desulfobacterales bacterium]|nr:hypothetical protein [Desulfobacterales bacterium]